eukprot:11860563-Ditylum_brightwellii.AAC.1
MDHLDDLIRNFTIDFKVIAEEFEQLIESTRDSTPDHDNCWPRHGPDPVFQTQQDVPYPHLIVDYKHHFDPGGLVYFNKSHNDNNEEESTRQSMSPIGIVRKCSAFTLTPSLQGASFKMSDSLPFGDGSWDHDFLLQSQIARDCGSLHHCSEWLKAAMT